MSAAVKTFSEPLLVPFTSSGRSHKLIVLPNGILTLLVSDPAEDLASAALCVAAGAHNDPDGIAGLAHFCEHLLLLGSKNFPDPAQFHELISKNGGRRNAFTNSEQTCYFFEVPSDAVYKDKNTQEPMFNRLLTMFADSLKAPAFPESMFEKEIYAIDNEHTANISKSGRAMYHGMRLISNPEHPFHRFATGNFFTLNDVPHMKKLNVKDHLQKYYQENYVADRMTLVIRGSQSLNQLQKLAIANFGDIQTTADRSQKKSKLKILSKSSSSKSISPVVERDIKDFDVVSAWDYNNTRIFTSKEANNCILINTAKTPILRMIFPTMDTTHPFSELFNNAWCHLLGDESSGSLDDVLKNKGYASGVSAFTQNLSQNGVVLVLEIKLTNTGAKKINDVISIIMTDYSQQMFQDPSVLARHLFEMESIDILNYLHQDVSRSPMEEASAYAQTLQKNMSILKPKNILKGNGNWDAPANFGTPEGDRYWTQRALEFQNYLFGTFSLRNMRFVLLCDEKLRYSLDPCLKYSGQQTDQFFNFDYSVGKFDPSFFAKPIGTEFKLIKKNKFIPVYARDHNKLRAVLQESSEKSSVASLAFSTKSSWSATEAKLIHKTDSFELWTKYENSKVFNSKVFLSFDIVSTTIDATPLNTMNTEILVELLKLKVSKRLYASELLGYSWSVFASLKGDVRFGFTVSGFVDGVDYLLEILIEGFKSIVEDCSFTSDEFRKSRVSVRARYGDLEQDNSFSLALIGLLVVMEEKIWTLEERLDVLDDIDTDSFKEFLSDFKTGSKFLKLFAHGDFKSAESYSVTINKITQHLNSGQPVKHKEPSTILLSPGSSYFITRDGPKNDPTNSVSFFIQTGPRNDAQTRQITNMLAFLMSLSLVPDLRFKKQLGYVVFGGVRLLRTTVGLHVSIMSATFSPQYLTRSIDDYLLTWEQHFDKMSEAEFKTEVLDSYLKTIGKTINESGGPESLTSEMLPSVGSSNCTSLGESMRQHQKLRDQIFTDDYQSKKDNDTSIIRGLSKNDFMNFFRQRVSPRATGRAQMAVMIKSCLSPEESRQQLMRLQLEAFLKMNGLRISSDKLKEMVEKSNGNAAYLMKDLFKHFMSQGESLRLCTIVLKEIFKQVAESMKHRESVTNSTATQLKQNETHEVEDIAIFQSQNSVLYAQ